MKAIISLKLGAVEVINRRLTGRNFHVYIKPERLVDPEAFWKFTDQ